MSIGCLFVLMVFLVGVDEKGEMPETADGTVRYMAEQMSQGKPVVLWDSLPAEYQQYIRYRKQMFAEMIDPEVYDGYAALLGKLAKVMKEKKRFCLNAPFFKPESRDTYEKRWEQYIAIIEAIVASEMGSHEAFKKVDIRELMDGSGAKVFGLIRDLPHKPLAKYGYLEAETTGTLENGDVLVTVTGILDLDFGEERPYTRMEGKWVRKELAEKWVAAIAKPQPDLENLTPEQRERYKGYTKEQFEKMARSNAYLDGLLDRMLAAETQEQFNEALEPAKMMIGYFVISGAIQFEDSIYEYVHGF